MGKAPARPRRKQRAKRNKRKPDVQALMKENAHLREVVTELVVTRLSELVSKNTEDE